MTAGSDRNVICHQQQITMDVPSDDHCSEVAACSMYAWTSIVR